MRKAFLSYCRSDNEYAERLCVKLAGAGVDVWRDQESLYAGQSWPGAIGEAITKQETIVLLWSANAATSHFVDFEWNTALALKKHIVPVLIDSTALPPSLRIFNAIPFGNADDAAHKIAMIPVDQKSESYTADEIIGKLKGVSTRSLEDAFSQAKAIFNQHGWQVGGNVYQVSGANVHVTIGGEEKDRPGKKKWWELWGSWVAVATATVGLIAAITGLPKVFRESSAPVVAPAGNQTVKLDGLVYDTSGTPIAGAIVTVDLLPGVTETTTTAGGFLFSKIPGQPGDRARILAAKPGYKNRDLYVVLPGPARITLEKQ
jgi:hypothetical protein